MSHRVHRTIWLHCRKASQTATLRTYTANEAKSRFGEFLDRVQREPGRVMRHDRVVGVMVSADDSRAPKDDAFVLAAIAAQASRLISGDYDLLCLHPLCDVSILSPRAAMEELEGTARCPP